MEEEEEDGGGSKKLREEPEMGVEVENSTSVVLLLAGSSENFL